jgi:hypothetical protein
MELGFYIVFNSVLLVINLVTSPDHLWFYWPLFGWGIGVIIHGLRVFASFAISRLGRAKIKTHGSEE